VLVEILETGAMPLATHQRNATPSARGDFPGEICVITIPKGGDEIVKVHGILEDVLQDLVRKSRDAMR